jgi:hypothetical protein
VFLGLAIFATVGIVNQILLHAGFPAVSPRESISPVFSSSFLNGSWRVSSLLLVLWLSHAFPGFPTIWLTISVAVSTARDFPCLILELQ